MENQLGKNIRHLQEEINGETLEDLGSKVFLSKTTISGMSREEENLILRNWLL